MRTRVITSLALPAALATAGLLNTAEAAYAGTLGSEGMGAPAEHRYQDHSAGGRSIFDNGYHHHHCTPFGNVTMTDYGHHCTPFGNMIMNDYGHHCTPFGNMIMNDYGYHSTPFSDIAFIDDGFVVAMG
jgi:hypothetical protein